MTVDLVVPTIGRPSLAKLLASIAAARGPRPGRVFVVDDRRDRTQPLALGEHDADFTARVVVVTGRAAGPAAARNAGWRASRAGWIAFVDDDVLVAPDWLDALARDLADAEPDVAGSQGRVTVPLPAGRRPTDWERNVAGLANALWITADCAYRRAELLAAGGFDERFPRAYREDADLALRVVARGGRITTGTRAIEHPVRPASWWISVRLQAGNADDVLMDALHGAGWRRRARAPRGAFRTHAFVVGSATVAVAAAFARRPRTARVASLAWLAATAAFAARRIAPGPRTPREVAALAVTSLAIPFAAIGWRLRGYAALPALLADRARAPKPTAPAVLFDRDGTLIADVPNNTDPARVVVMPHARAALERLREAGVATAVVTNQGAIGLGLVARADAAAINARAEALLGPLGPVFACEHAPDAGCACRKPAPGLILEAARALGVRPRDCVVIGDIGSDVDAARAAGARAILVATDVTRREEIAAAPLVAADLADAVRLVLEGAA